MKKIIPGYLAIALVWFSSHFGGGFASGRQIVAFYLNHNWTSLFMPAVSMFIMGICMYYSMVIAARFRAYDYSTWSKKLYGEIGFFAVPVYEILVNSVLLLATAVAFATGGTILSKLFGTSYMMNTFFIAAVIFVLTIYGSELVRKSAIVVSFLLIVSMFIIYLPNIIHYFPKIVQNLAAIKSGEIATSGPDSFWDALWWGVKYGTLHCCAIGAYIVHAQVCPDKSCLKKAIIIGVIINSLIMYLTYFGILAFVDQGILKEAVPALFVVMHGLGGSWMTSLISFCIVIGAVSTGVALVYGTTNRLVTFFGRNLDDAGRLRRQRFHSMIASTILVSACWLVAQLGLIPLIGKGYGSMGWVTMFLITIPIVLRGLGIWRFPEDRVKGES
ncbi:YkvI family membrane protein [Maridesulfovibrio zosterae]|uniref:YkvI family membrane protein n=1 Tax=Maridesulfovibrio zosterae TaxID=82171 RepID=UPI0004029B9E|nr:hypothetical protein [Maridesulfovibrio zosterae]